MTWGAGIGTILTALLPLVQYWLANAPDRKQKEREDAIQQGRKDIASGNAAVVTERIDKLLTDASRPTGQPSCPVTTERINAVCRVADPGRNTSTNS